MAEIGCVYNLEKFHNKRQPPEVVVVVVVVVCVNLLIIRY